MAERFASFSTFPWSLGGCGWMLGLMVDLEGLLLGLLDGEGGEDIGET